VRTLLQATLKAAELSARPELDAVGALEDVLLSLLAHLDLSWIGPDRGLTTEILRVVVVFSLAVESQWEKEREAGEEKEEEEEKESVKGEFAALIRGEKYEAICNSIIFLISSQT